MGLKTAKARAKTVPVGEVRTLTAMIEGDEESLSFTVPGLAQIKEAISLSADAQAEYLLPADMAITVVLLGKTYVPSADDGVINPVAEFAEMATVQPELFIEISTKHGELMIDCLDWMKVKSHAKNASGESAPAQ